MRNMIFLIKSNAISYCPICGEPLIYRDSCERGMLLEGRERRRFLIRRLKCSKCGKLHRELPDFLAPFKQYATEIISGVLDGIVQPEDEDSVDYPCEKTTSCWHHWLMANQPRIDGYLKSIGYCLLGFSEVVLCQEKVQIKRELFSQQTLFYTAFFSNFFTSLLYCFSYSFGERYPQ